MSLRSYTVTCDRCQHSSTQSRATVYRYAGPPETAPPPRYGWCAQCDAVTVQLVPLSEKEAKDERSILGGVRTSRMLAKFCEDAYLAARMDEMDAVEKRLEYFARTPYPLRCLKCGGTDVSPIPEEVIKEGRKSDTGIIHRCGGSLQVEGNTIRISYRDDRPATLYDAEGRICGREGD